MEIAPSCHSDRIKSLSRSMPLLGGDDFLRLGDDLIRQFLRADDRDITALVENKIHNLEVDGVADCHQ